MTSSRNLTSSRDKGDELDDKIAKNHPFASDTTYQECLDYMKSAHMDRVKQANNASSVFYQAKGNLELNPEVYAAYPKSQTAQRYKQAFDLYLHGWYVLKSYHKDKIESLEDCDYIQPAFHSYAYAVMCEHHLLCKFMPPENTTDLIDQYLKFRPEDILVEYFKVILILSRSRSTYNEGDSSDYELQKRLIITGEEFAHKRMPFTEFSEVDREILKNIYYTLGAIYVTTDQSRRALDSFQKCYELDTTNYSALYGIAYQYMERDPDKAISLFLKFIEKAPVCDKQYPNAHYMLASLFLSHYKNEKEALRYCKLAEDAESKRLSFLYPVDIPQKSMMQMFKSLHHKFRK